MYYISFIYDSLILNMYMIPSSNTTPIDECIGLFVTCIFIEYIHILDGLLQARIRRDRRGIQNENIPIQ